jgi:hypothetical protein
MDVLANGMTAVYLTFPTASKTQGQNAPCRHLCHQSLATPTWSVLRNWFLSQHNINHRCGSVTLMTYSRFGFMAQRSYRISSSTIIV